MATTPNYGWVTPAPTDFVTDLPADFETFADAVDADLAGLLGGTTGQILTKDSNTDHDFSWQNAGGGGAGFTLLNTGGTALTGNTTITVSGISNRERLLVLIKGGSSANASSNITVRFNTDTASNYEYSGVELNGISTWAASNFSVIAGTQTSFPIASMSSNAGSEVYGSILLEGGKSTSSKSVVASGGATISTASSQSVKIYNGLYLGTSAITSVSVVSSTGNFDNGTVFVYGSSN